MRRVWQSLRRRIRRDVAAVAFLCTAGVVPFGISLAPADDAISLPLSAPVKVLPQETDSPETPMEDVPAAQPPRPQPTLPGGKLPQYQLDHRHRAMPSTEELQDATLRLLLVLPSRPLLLEAHITIDGQPFRMVREKRIEEILAAASEPVTDTGDEEAGDNAEGGVEVKDSAAKSPNERLEDDPPKDAGDAEDDADPGSDAEKEAEAEADADAQKEAEAGEPEPEPVAPPTVAPYALPATASDYVRRYFAGTGKDVSTDEVRWLLTNRLDGPALLMLNDNFQRFRANQRPVFDVLDRNGDGIVAADELERAVSLFQECDRTRDDIVDYAEIAAAGDNARRRKAVPAGPGKLIFESADAVSIAKFALAFAKSDSVPAGESRGFDAATFQSVWDGEPDVTLTVAFNTADPSRSTLALTRLSAVLEKAAAQTIVDGTTMTLTVDETPIAFSAIQRGPSDQVSIGAVIDGYPILPAIDPNDDGRFTIREMRELIDRLRQFDRNHDGRLTAEETQSPLRLCVGLGPLVHQELAGIRSVNRPAKTPASTGPEWFVRMDRNRDNDLTRNEFPGTDAQFAAMDADGDALVSAEEAVRFERQSPNPKS